MPEVQKVASAVCVKVMVSHLPSPRPRLCSAPLQPSLGTSHLGRPCYFSVCSSLRECFHCGAALAESRPAKMEGMGCCVCVCVCVWMGGGLKYGGIA